MVFPLGSVKDFRIEITEEHELFRRTVRKFAEDKVAPIAMEIEKKNEIPRDLLMEAKRLGFMGVGIPEEYGGQGGDNIMMAILTEELARVSPAFALATIINQVYATPILLFGTEEQKKKFIPPVAAGDSFGGHANTEPVAGSDIAGIQSTAVKKGDYWVLNGRKMFITGAEKADYFVVSARTSPPQPGNRWWGISLFIVTKDMPGFKLGQRINVTGVRGEQPYEIILDNVRVPEENVLKPLNEGFKMLVSTYDHTRIVIAALAVGIAQAVFEKALRYSLDRKAFEEPIISYQAVSFKIADMFMELEAARLLTYWAATLADQGREEYVLASSLAKAFATEAAERAALAAIKVHGGVGVDVDTGIERYLRDALIVTITEGTNEIQRLTVIRTLVRRYAGLLRQIA
ncbi:acyl-CoA dehydrogenase [Candidatus Geothermarchaeota archaeon ex4572_27]|nr:MAG: acyl-CoA dehydrogenase [Candidatus Geothermarchaeota archaeon ex4572_27]